MIIINAIEKCLIQIVSVILALILLTIMLIVAYLCIPLNSNHAKTNVLSYEANTQ